MAQTRKASFIYYVGMPLCIMLIIFGALIVYILQVQEQKQQIALREIASHTEKRTDELGRIPQKAVNGTPLQLDIDRLDIHLAVQNGQYDTASGQWTLSEDRAQFATSTAKPNNTSGVTLIYGHNSIPVFEKTASLLVGDELTIKTDNHYTFYYRYSGDSLVNPDDTAVLSATSDKPRLALLTCSGWLSDHRRVMYFDLAGVTKTS